jgi:hypothetical protein
LKDTLYLQRDDGTLYRFVPAKDGLFGLHSVFASDTLKVGQIFSSVRGLVFTGYAEGARELSDIYLLGEELAAANEQLPVTQAPKNLQFEGDDEFLTYGLTTEQLAAFQIAFENYTKSANRQGELAVVTEIKPVPHDRFSSSTVNTINFVITWSNESLNAKMDYSELVNVRLYLYKQKDSSLIFDSQVVSGS